MSKVAASALLFLSLLAVFAGAASARSLQQVSGCSGSVVNSAIGKVGQQSSALVANALASAWPSVSSQLTSRLGAENITQVIPATKPMTFKKCVRKTCINFNATVAGSVSISKGVLTGLATPTARIDNITCGPSLGLFSTKGTAVVVATIGLSAKSVSFNVSGTVTATVTTANKLLGLPTKLPVTIRGTVYINNITGTTKATTAISVSVAISSGQVAYSLAVKSFNNTFVGFSSANFTPSKAQTGAYADISNQVQQYVSGLLMSRIDSELSAQIQAVLNQNTAALKYNGTYKM